MQAFINNPVVGLVVCLVLGALAVSGKLSVPFANALLLLAWGVGTYELINAGFRDLRLTIAPILAMGAVLILLSYWISPTIGRPATTSTEKTAPSGTNPTAAKSTSRPATLKDLFENDWPDVPAYYNVSVLQIGEAAQHKEINLAWRLNADFQARSQFLAFLLESNLSPVDAVDICVFLADHYQQFIETANSQVDIAGKWPTDTSTTHLRELVFSKRIFIYYGNPELSLEQMGSIEVLYKQKGLSIQFRGTDYQWLHRNDHPPFRPKPLVAGAVLFPRALGTGLEIFVTKLSPSVQAGRPNE